MFMMRAVAVAVAISSPASSRSSPVRNAIERRFATTCALPISGPTLAGCT